MDPTALLLSRIQFGFTISFHIIFPAFTIGLAAWLTVLEALHLQYVRAMQAIIAESKPNQCVGLYCSQLLDLGAATR